MKKDNSYLRYRQYRQNRRRYKADAGILPGLILIACLSSVFKIIRVIFIISLLVLAIYVIYRVINNKKQKNKTIEITIDEMSNDTFVNYCTQLLALNNFANIRIAQNNKGINILAEKERLVYGIKCVIGQDTVDADVIRKAISGGKYYFCDKTVILTNKQFSPNAKNLADSKNILLWDRQKFKEMTKKDSRVKIIPDKSVN